MSHLSHRQQKIQEKRKKTPWRSFVKEILARYPLVLYRNDGTLSRYPETTRSPQIGSGGDASLQETGLTHDEDMSFFEHMQTLFLSMPLKALIQFQGVENSDYADIISTSKNAYLSWNVTNGNENVMYSLGVKENSKNVYNSMMVRSNSQVVYQSVGVINSFNIFYARYIYNSSDIWFSANMMNCHHCLFCNGLENQSYCIKNKQYTKEEYAIKKTLLLKEKHLFEKRSEDIAGIKAINYGSEESTGNFVLHSREIEHGRFVYNVHHSRNVILAGYDYEEEHLYDAIFSGAKAHCYGTLCCGSKSEHLYSCFGIESSFNMYYCYKCSSCSHCLGCVDLQNKEFCVFNKQYEKEERHRKVDEIFGNMEKEGTLGSFFPGSMNPFYFNDTAASLIEDFDKEEVVNEGYLRRDEEIKVDIPEWMEVVEVSELGKYEEQSHPELDSGSHGISGDAGSESSMTDTSWWIDPTILKKVIRDEDGNVYRIIKMEYDFLMKHGLPLPRKHWLGRLKEHLRIK